MQTVILCGGKGTRMREETEYRPKPMVEIGGKPILWHIMKTYAHHGFNEFVLTLGYKGAAIKQYFLSHRALANDFTLGTRDQSVEFHHNRDDDFKITFAETGEESLTGKRLMHVERYLKGDEFMLTYGDGVADVRLDRLAAFHRKQGTIGTLTGVHPHSKYGLVKIDKRSMRATEFYQKPRLSDYVNGGFMIFKKKIFDYLDEGPIEEALMRLARKRELSVFAHQGFWKAMDTYQEAQDLNDLWDHGRPWAVWDASRQSV